MANDILGANLSKKINIFCTIPYLDIIFKILIT